MAKITSAASHKSKSKGTNKSSVAKAAKKSAPVKKSAAPKKAAKAAGKKAAPKKAAPKTKTASPAKKIAAGKTAKKAVKTTIKKASSAPVRSSARQAAPVRRNSTGKSTKQASDQQITQSMEYPKRSKSLPKAFYPQKDLDEFRVNIEGQIIETREELTNVSGLLMDVMTGEYEEENSVYSLHMADQGTDAMEREKAFLQAQRQNDYLKKLNEALARIENRSYGVCTVCGELIEKQRLLAVPVTQKHVDCKNKEASSPPPPPSRDEDNLSEFNETT